MKRIYKLLLAVLMLSSYSAKAQYDGVTFTFLNNIPYINYYNPGARVPYLGIVGVAFSNLNFNVTNSSLLYKNIYRFDNGKPVAIAASDFVGTLKENGNFIKTGFSLCAEKCRTRVKRVRHSDFDSIRLCSKQIERRLCFVRKTPEAIGRY